MGSLSRSKGAGYELEIVHWLRERGYDVHKISGMYKDGPDIKGFGDRYIEARRRAANYESLNVAKAELAGDASMYWTRLDNETGDHLVVMWATTLLDMLDEQS